MQLHGLRHDFRPLKQAHCNRTLTFHKFRLRVHVVRRNQELFVHNKGSS